MRSPRIVGWPWHTAGLTVMRSSFMVAPCWKSMAGGRLCQGWGRTACKTPGHGLGVSFIIAAMARGTEIVIIGGGVVGLSIAYHLAARGCDDVCVLERGQIGQGATAKAAGGVPPQFSRESKK